MLLISAGEYIESIQLRLYSTGAGARGELA
jgi:hypothetical protein